MRLKSAEVFLTVLAIKQNFEAALQHLQRDCFLLTIMKDFPLITTDGIFSAFLGSQWKACLFSNFRYFCLYCGSQVSSTRKLLTLCLSSLFRIKKHFSLQFIRKSKQGCSYPDSYSPSKRVAASIGKPWLQTRPLKIVPLAGTISLIIKINPQIHITNKTE